MPKPYRVGMIVPSSNTTMETEIPAMLNKRMEVEPEKFTFHSSRMRMLNVNPEELKKMDAASDRCVQELADAHCDVMAYACLVAIMCQGAGYHCESESRLSKIVRENNLSSPVVSSAGALIQGIEKLGAKRVSIITPYMKPLTNMVVDYIEDSNIEVQDAISLEVPDNIKVGQLDPLDLLEHVERLDKTNVDAVVLSACVQMPSLPALQKAEDKIGLPVLSAASATVYNILESLNIKPTVENAGSLLSGKNLVNAK